MTIASEISRLQQAKSDIKTAIEGKWVEVGSNVKLDEYAACIWEIQQWATEWILPITAPTLTGVAEHWKNCLKLNDPDNDSCRWTQLTCWTKSTVVRKVWSSPASIDDWTVVFTTTTKDQYASTYYVDSWLTNWCTYHYRAFADVSVWKPNCSSVVCLKPTAWATISVMLVWWWGGGWGWCYDNDFCWWWWGWWWQVVICNSLSIWAQTTVVIWAGWAWWRCDKVTNWWDTKVGTVIAYWWWHWWKAFSSWSSWWNWWWWWWRGWYWWAWCNYCWWDACNYSSWWGGWWAWGNWYKSTSQYEPWDWWSWCYTNFSWVYCYYAWGGGWWLSSWWADRNVARWWAWWWWTWWKSHGDWCGATYYWWWWGGYWWWYGWCYWWAWFQWLVIIKYPTSCWYTITWWQCCYTCNWYKYHCFTSNWTITVS